MTFNINLKKTFMIHELKTWPPYFNAVLTGKKRFEYRKNDRNFSVGDYLHLLEYIPGVTLGEYTGLKIKVLVLYILPLGEYCILSIELC